MKNEPQSRRTAQSAGRRRPPSSAAAILKGGPAARGEDYFSPRWILLWLTLITIALVAFLFTPYTHQLDEIKNVILMLFPPFLLVGALVLKNFHTFSWRTHGSTILLGLFFVNMVFSFIINDYKLTGERVIWFWAACGTFTVVFAWYLDSELKMRRAMLFWTLLGLVSTILGLFMFAGQGFTAVIYDFMRNDPFWRDSPWTTLFYTLKMSRGDMYSFVLNQDFYAAFLVMTLPIPLAMFFAEQKMIYRAISLSTFLLMNVCLILTNSNDSYPSIIVGYILFAILCVRYVKGWNFSRRFIIVFLICIGGLLAEVAILMLPTVAQTWEFKSAAFEGRKVLWGGGFWPWLYGHDRSKTHLDIVSILFGVGPGGYRHFFPWFRRPDFFDQQINNVTTFGHNWYLDVLLETGAVGLLLFLWFHFRVIKDALNQIRTTQSRTHLLYQVAIVCGLAGIAIQNFSSPNNRWAVAGMTYWAMFGLSMGLYQLEHPADQERQKRDALIPKAAKIAALIFALVFVVRSAFQQAIPYWYAAKLNATGLKYMDAAQSPDTPEEHVKEYLDYARRLFESAIHYNPTFATSYYKLGNVYNSQFDTEKAVATYEQLNEISPSYSEIWLNLGIMYYMQANDLQQSVTDLRKEAEKKLADAAKARADERQQLKDEAAQLMEQAKTLEQKLPEKKLHLYEKSYASLQEAARQSLKPNVQALAADQGRELADIYDENGEKEKADRIREEMKNYYWTILTYEPKLEEVKAERKKKYPIAEERLLKLAQQTGKLSDAEAVLKRMVAENPDNQQYLNLLLRTYDAEGKTADKIKYLEGAVHDNPVDPHIRSVLADAYSKSGDREKYLAELKRVETLDPANPTALSSLYLAYKGQDTGQADQYRGKLQKIGVNADDLTTIIKEGTSTASISAAAKSAAAKAAAAKEAAGTSAPAPAEAAPSARAGAVPAEAPSAVSAPGSSVPVEVAPSARTAPPAPAHTSTAPANADTSKAAATSTPAPATSVTAASAAVTAPTPVTQPPPPGVKSSDAVVTAPSAESSTSKTK